MSTGTRAFAIAVAQFVPGDDTEANLVEIARLAELAADRGAGLVVFPEYSSYFTPQAGADWVDAAQSRRRAVHRGARRARRSPRRPPRRRHDRAGRGRVAAWRTPSSRWRRTRASSRAIASCTSTTRSGSGSPSGSPRARSPRPRLFTAGGLTFGLQTCYDARFPEVTRRIVDAGADVVCMPAEWVRGPLKEAHWRVLTTARALENTIYVAAADHAPPVGAGNSMIVDPMGVELVDDRRGDGCRDRLGLVASASTPCGG